MQTSSTIFDYYLEKMPANEAIGNNFIKGWSIINASKYRKILCSVSGGSDSDIMVDLITKMDIDGKVDYIFFDTGIEYAATKRHLSYLEKRYHIRIKRIRADKPVALMAKAAQPFLNKHPVSEYVHRLQINGFLWDDEPYEVLINKYPNCKMALQWWCNCNEDPRCNIRQNKWLKEFMKKNPPEFPIGHICCEYAKRKPVAELIRAGGYDLCCVGMRKAERGARAIHGSCFIEGKECDHYRPVWWYSDSDKVVYEKHFKIVHSDCYSVYGLRRTGCAGCPFGRNTEAELSAAEAYEPRIYNAVKHIFKDSYAYTESYKEFRKQMDAKMK